MLVLLMGKMSYTVGMSSSATKYIYSNFNKCWFSYSEVIKGRSHRLKGNIVSLLIVLQNKESKLIGIFLKIH
jgi:hypothetical protein